MKESFNTLILLLFSFSLSCHGQFCSPSNGLREGLEERRPLRPMAYTEYLGATPEGTAVREERIARALLEGADEEWGALTVKRNVDLSTPKKLQDNLIKALFTRDATLWDSLFISAEDYASLVHVDDETSQRFVEKIQADSSQIWDTFTPESAADGLPGGFQDVFDVQPIDLGAGRTLSGRLVTEEEQPQQFWGSTFLLQWKPQPAKQDNHVSGVPPLPLTFKVYLPKIIRIRSAGVTKYQLAGKISVDSSIHLFLRTGLDLKPQVMRSTEYPIPATVGNYWRYRRFIGERKTESIDPFKLENEDDAVMSVDATRAVDEITRVDDYTHWKLVEIRRSFNDTELTKLTRYWLLFPRGIYLCNRYCRTHISDIRQLLFYVADRVPLYVFPIHSSMTWGPSALPEGAPAPDPKKLREDETPDVPNEIKTYWREPLTTAAGTFEQIIEMRGPAALDTFPIAETGLLSRDFVWGKGIVRRFAHDQNLTEELIEVRVR